MLDYARALRVAINPPPLGLVTLTTLVGNTLRGVRQRREIVAQIHARVLAARAAAITGKSRGDGTKSVA